jgi:mannose-1-phosphate guanylyltransferase
VAERMLKSGYLWNSGIFVWRAGDFLDEVRAHTPEVAPALDAGASIEEFFATAKSISVDVHAVDARGNVVHAEGSTVVLYGVSDLVVITQEGLTVVTTIDRAADLKSLVEQLPREVRDRR